MEDVTRPDRTQDRIGQIAVIFVSRRNDIDAVGYAVAATAMETLAAVQPGYRGLDSARGDDGIGITISWWADEAAAIAWREHPAHAVVREGGRSDWYDAYEVAVTSVTRHYGWTRA